MTNDNELKDLKCLIVRMCKSCKYNLCNDRYSCECDIVLKFILSEISKAEKRGYSQGYHIVLARAKKNKQIIKENSEGIK